MASMRLLRFSPFVYATVLALWPSTVSADETYWVSPGVKLAYTFGEGFTFGAELSVVHVPDADNASLGELLERGVFVGRGGVLSWDWTPAKSLQKLHLGAQWVGPGIGLEVGPTLVTDDQGTYFGIGVSPWAGTYAIPYYAYTAVFGRKDNLHELGLHLKVHLCVSGRDACGDGDDFDFD